MNSAVSVDHELQGTIHDAINRISMGKVSFADQVNTKKRKDVLKYQLYGCKDIQEVYPYHQLKEFRNIFFQQKKGI